MPAPARRPGVEGTNLMTNLTRLAEADRGRRSTLKRQRGAIGGIPEQVLAIGVGTILVAGMVSLGNRAFVGSRISQDVTTIQVLANQTRKLFEGMPEFPHVTNMSSTLINAGIQPDGWAANGTTDWRNRFGLQAYVRGEGPQFRIYYEVDSLSTCLQIIAATPPGKVNAVRGPGGTISAPPPYSPEASRTACGTGNGHIRWVFAK